MRDLLSKMLGMAGVEISTTLPTFLGELLDLKLEKFQVSFGDSSPCKDSFTTFTLKECVDAIIVEFSLPQ